MEGTRETRLAARRLLDKELCDKLVQSASLTIGCNVLITDALGIVVASDDARRVGTLHEASIEVIRTRQTTYHNKEAAAKLVGTRPGMTIPLLMGSEVIGTIGVTGTPQEISRYVVLTQQMAQVFLGFYSQRQTSVQLDYRKQNLLREIVTFDKRIRDPAEVYNVAYEAGVDLHIPRVAIVLKNGQEGGRQPGEEGVKMAKTLLMEAFPGEQDFLCPQNDTEYVVLACLPDGMRESSMEKVMAVCQDLDRRLRQAGLSALVGVGSLAKSLEGLRLSYENAFFVVRALQNGLREGSCLSIDDLMLEKLAASLPDAVCHEAETGVFASIVEAPNYREIMEIIEHWCRLRFQFTRTAEALHIHKSTLVYRFRRIQEIYGLDLYDFDRVMALYLLHVRRKLK